LSLLLLLLLLLLMKLTYANYPLLKHTTVSLCKPNGGQGLSIKDVRKEGEGFLINVFVTG